VAKGSWATDRCQYDATKTKKCTIAMHMYQTTNENEKCSFTEHDRFCHGLRKLTCHAGHEQHQRDAPHDVVRRLATSAATESLDHWFVCKGLAAELASDGLYAQDALWR
jgi:hypothetical protein